MSTFKRWAFEAPSNNRSRAPITITYREADLRIRDLVTPDSAASGDTITASFPVLNGVMRETRESSWPDRLFRSRDA